MADITKEDIEAVDILGKEIAKVVKQNSQTADYSFTSVIKAVNANGTYTVLDRNGIERDVKCVIPGLPLSVGKNVWLKMPCGDIKKLHIYGVV